MVKQKTDRRREWLAKLRDMLHGEVVNGYSVDVKQPDEDSLSMAVYVGTDGTALTREWATFEILTWSVGPVLNKVGALRIETPHPLRARTYKHTLGSPYQVSRVKDGFLRAVQQLTDEGRNA